MHMTDKVNGIVLINTNESHLPDNFSPDYSCPDSQYGMNTLLLDEALITLLVV